MNKNGLKLVLRFWLCVLLIIAATGILVFFVENYGPLIPFFIVLISFVSAVSYFIYLMGSRK